MPMGLRSYTISLPSSLTVLPTSPERLSNSVNRAFLSKGNIMMLKVAKEASTNVLQPHHLLVVVVHRNLADVAPAVSM